MNRSRHDNPDDIWSTNSPEVPTPKGLYVAISGNTAAGKSTIINRIQARQNATDRPVYGITEGKLHHPYFRLMFSDPEAFAYPLQLNFVIQRHLLLLRLLGIGKIVVMERSHLDDNLFADAHVINGAISPYESKVYQMLISILHERIPNPDMLFLLNPDPEVSFARLKQAEESGDRSMDFPNDETKMMWIHKWHEAYKILHSTFHSRSKPGGDLSSTTVISLDPLMNPDDAASIILSEISQRIR